MYNTIALKSLFPGTKHFSRNRILRESFDEESGNLALSVQVCRELLYQPSKTNKIWHF
jgi:hypothetical protein